MTDKELVENLRKWSAVKPAEDQPLDKWWPDHAKFLAEVADRLALLSGVSGALSKGAGDFRTIVRDLPRNEPRGAIEQPKPGDG